MSRIYELPFISVATPGTNPFVQLSTPSTTAITILKIECGQVGYATGGMERITGTLKSTATTMTTSATPAILDDTTRVASLLTGSTTTNAYAYTSGSGTLVTTNTFAPFYNLQGFLYTPIPEEMIRIAASRFYTLQFASAPAGGTWSGRIIYREE